VNRRCTAAAAVVVLAAVASLVAAAATLASYRATDALLVPHSFGPPLADLDPKSAYGMRFRTVRVDEPLGSAPAWYVRGSSTRWAIVVHAMGAPRAQGLPVLPLLRRLGFSTLVISYRNDPAAPASPDGLSHLGADEWHDLDGAAAYAQRHGAQRQVLIGYSMGGAMVCDFLRRSPRAGRVVAAVLDSPVLEWRRPLAAAAARASLPKLLIGPAEELIGWRTGVRLAEEDQLAHAAELHTPMLLLHGTADAVVPIADSRALAAEAPGRVRLVGFPGAGHVTSWQTDPRRYVAAVEAFLREVRA